MYNVIMTLPPFTISYILVKNSNKIVTDSFVVVSSTTETDELDKELYDFMWLGLYPAMHIHCLC
jgi:hypothetical protein